MRPLASQFFSLGRFSNHPLRFKSANSKKRTRKSAKSYENLFGFLIPDRRSLRGIIFLRIEVIDDHDYHTHATHSALCAASTDHLVGLYQSITGSSRSSPAARWIK